MRGKGKDWIRGMEDPSGYVFGSEKPDVWFKPEEWVLGVGMVAIWLTHL